jgi:hypothetical protein
MDAITVSPTRRELLDEYRIALRIWSEAKALYRLDSPEVSEATNILDQLQQDLVVSHLRDLQRPKEEHLSAMES